jgi:hypothetical protein
MKRLREQQRMEKRRAKQARRRDRTDSDAVNEAAPDGVDPDIAHIVPGPQPVPWDEDGFNRED